MGWRMSLVWFIIRIQCSGLVSLPYIQGIVDTYVHVAGTDNLTPPCAFPFSLAWQILRMTFSQGMADRSIPVFLCRQEIWQGQKR